MRASDERPRRVRRTVATRRSRPSTVLMIRPSSISRLTTAVMLPFETIIMSAIAATSWDRSGDGRSRPALWKARQRGSELLLQVRLQPAFRPPWHSSTVVATTAVRWCCAEHRRSLSRSCNPTKLVAAVVAWRGVDFARSCDISSYAKRVSMPPQHRNPCSRRPPGPCRASSA